MYEPESSVLNIRPGKWNGQHTRNIDTQNNDQKPPESRVQLRRRLKRLNNHRALAANAEGIQDVESVIST